MNFWTRLLAVCALAACGGNSGGGGDEDDVSKATLTLDPASTELEIVNSVAAHATFTATLTWPDGHTKDVTAETLFGVDQNAGSFVGNELTLGVSGKTQVYGMFSDKTASAQVIARLKAVRVDSSLPANTPDLFNGSEDAALAPAIVYPPADAVMPRNIGDFEIHWTDSHSNDVFELSLHTEFADVKVYVPGRNGIPEQGPGAAWAAFQAVEWLGTVGNETKVSFRVRGANSKAPGKVGAAAPQDVQLSNERMLGGLYYWASAASNNVYGIYRHDMDKPGQAAEEFLTTKQTNGRCVACHVLSRDGSQMAITYDGGNQPATMVDVGTAKPATMETAWNFGTFTPDKSQFLGVHDGDLVVRDAKTQAVLTTMPSTVRVSHPDLSPDGTKLVYVRHEDGAHDWDFANGQLYTRTYNQATRSFGPEVPLVNDGKTNFYPSWSPDGAWVVFNKAASGANVYDQANTSTWVVKADGSQPPVQLAAADQANGLTNSWPRWAPFPQTFGAANEQMFWITIASKRDFGVRLRNTGLAQRPALGDPSKRSQLWMTPFFPARAAQGKDPSTKAFRLPFQNLDSSNHIAQWTERVVVIQ